MATYQLLEDNLMTCPIDPVHRVSARRYQLHVHSCRKKHPGEFESCPLNSGHVVRMGQLEAHLLRCPDRNKLVRGMRERLAGDEQEATRRRQFESRVTSRTQAAAVKTEEWVTDEANCFAGPGSRPPRRPEPVQIMRGRIEEEPPQEELDRLDRLEALHISVKRERGEQAAAQAAARSAPTSLNSARPAAGTPQFRCIGRGAPLPR